MFAAGVNIAARYTSDAGDILGFIGGAVGAGAAVIGAKWLEDSKTRKGDRESVEQIEKSLVHLWTRGVNLEQTTDKDAVARILSAKQALDLLNSIQKRVIIRNIDTASLVETFVHWTPTIMGWIERELKYINDGASASSRLDSIRLIGKALKDQVEIAFNYGAGWTGVGKSTITRAAT